MRRFSSRHRFVAARSNCQSRPRLLPASARGNWNHPKRGGGSPRPRQVYSPEPNSICHCPFITCAVASVNGVLENCTKKSPPVLVASKISPASSGLFLVGCQTACPCCTRQPGDDRSAGGSGGIERHETKREAASASATVRTAGCADSIILVLVRGPRFSNFRGLG